MENNEMVKIFNELYQLELQARDYYDNFLPKIEKEEEIEMIKSIRDDEIRHMELVEKLIKLYSE